MSNPAPINPALLALRERIDAVDRELLALLGGVPPRA
jgi:chorismate mutase